MSSMPSSLRSTAVGNSIQPSISLVDAVEGFMAKRTMKRGVGMS